MVVEDELLVAMELEDLLEKQGCEVIDTLATIGEALECISRERPEIALLDLNLDGEPTIAIAHELDKYGIPFVIISGHVETVIREPVLQKAPFIQKPWKNSELLRRIEEMLV